MVLLLLSTGNCLQAQNHDIHIPEKGIDFFRSKIDSLSYLVAAGKTITYSPVCLLAEHDNYFMPGINISFPKQLLRATDQLKRSYAQAYWLNQEAIFFYERQDYPNASLYWQKALDIAIANDFNYEELHSFRVALNNNYFLAGDYAGAMKISTAGLDKAEQINDKNRMAHFNNVIGFIHMKQKNFIEARRYFLLYLQQARDMKNSTYEAHALYNLADLALARNQYDSAIQFLQQSIAVYRSLGETKYKSFDLQEREAYISNKLAEAHKLKSDSRTALQFGMLSINVIRNAGALVNDYDEASYYINVGDIYNRLQIPDSAILFLRSGLHIARTIIHREHIRDASEQLSVAFARKKMFDSAYYYHRLFFNLWDTIANEESKREILQLEADLRIAREQHVQQAVLVKQRMWRNIILAIAASFIIILYLLYNRYRLRQKNKYQAALNRRQQEILHTTITVQDRERKRISEDLHDSLGSILSAAKLKLSAIGNDQVMPEEEEKLQSALLLLDEAVTEMRNISYNIMPATLSKLGLIAALQNLFNRITSRSGLKISFNTYGFTGRLEGSTEVSIYRIILESINNVVKHAKARQVTVQLVKYPDHINITIEDDGLGFDREKVQDGSAGLINIKSRVEYLKGNIDVDTKEGNGTTILIDIPYELDG
jgi:signal transduction histidine kinase